MRMILMCSNIHKYGEKVKQVITDNLGYEVYYISPDSSENYDYQNIFKKLVNNLIRKPLLKRGLKEIKRDKELIKKIKGFGEFELVLVIFASYHSKGVLEYLQQKKKTMYCHFWDSFSYFPKQTEYLKYFQYKSSFDPKEAKEYGMKFIPNFYFENDIVTEQIIEYDAFTILKYDERYSLTEKIAKYFYDTGIKYLFIVVTKKNIKSDYIDIREETISLAQVYDYYSKCRCIVEIGHNDDNEKQSGLSFRAIEALGNRKKLITNYAFIKDYDFYNKENIFIMDDENLNEINGFLSLPYKFLDEKIYKKYNSESWIKEILL